MPKEITVALVGDPTDDWGSIDEPEWERVWDDRPKATISVESDESLAAVIDRAARALSLPPAPYGQEYWRAIDVTTRLRKWRKFAPLTLVDDDGRAVWSSWDARLIPYSEVVRAVEAEAMPGDSRELYLVLRYPGGNGVYLAWPELIESVKAAWEVGRVIAEAGGIYAAFKVAHDLVQARLRRGEKVVSQEAYRWDQRDAEPRTFRDFLGERSWDPKVLAPLLDGTEEDAQAVLEVFGYARDESDGLWRISHDQAARVMLVILDEAASYAHEDSEAREFRRRIDHYMRTGEVLPHAWDEPYEPFEDFERRERLRKGAIGAGIAAIGGALGFFLGRLRR